LSFLAKVPESLLFCFFPSLLMLNTQKKLQE
jgi:hypothetical protein